MQTKSEMIQWISENPAEVLDDIEALKMELSKDSIELSQMRKREAVWRGVALKYFEKWRRTRKAAMMMVKVQKELDAI